MQLFSSLPPGHHQSRLLEETEVLHDPEPRHLQLGLELRERAAVTREESVEQESPSRVGQCLEHAVVVGHGEQYVTKWSPVNPILFRVRLRALTPGQTPGQTPTSFFNA